MDYGEIFVSTFRIIWHQKRLWGLGLLGRIVASLGIVAGGLIGANLLRSWFALLPALVSGSGGVPPNFGQFGASWALLACVGLILGLAGYIVHLIARAAIIGEAANAWAGRTVDTRRGLRTGARRAVDVFALDLLWWVPIGIVIAGAYLVAVLSWVGIASSATNGRNASAAPIVLAVCGTLCCLLLLGLLIAAVFGIFAPLMYQAAVQPGSADPARPGERRTLGRAIAEGWSLARSHMGSMFIFWLLVAVVAIVAGMLVQAVVYPFSLAALGSWMSWMSQLMQSGAQRVPVFPSAPPVNSGFLVGATLVQAIASLILYSFTDAFGLTLYAAVYRRLTGGELSALAVPQAPPPPPSEPEAGTGAATRPAEPPLSERPAAAEETTHAAASEASGEPQPPQPSGSARIYPTADDTDLRVPNEPPPEDQPPPLV